MEVHHTITFYIATEWEHAEFNTDGDVPYGLLIDWVGEKEYDKDREQRAAKADYSGKLPETYEEFESKFSFEKPDDSVPLVFRVLKERPRKTVDWLFRVYAVQYNHSWDPHYYTSLYSAMRLYMGDAISDEGLSYGSGSGTALFCGRR